MTNEASDFAAEPDASPADALHRCEAAAARIATALQRLPDTSGDTAMVGQLRDAIAAMATNLDHTIAALDSQAAASEQAAVSALGVE